MPQVPKNLMGMRFGRLVVIGTAEQNSQGKTQWFCECDCGTKKAIGAVRLIDGSTTSCGCYKMERIKEGSTTHGHTTSGVISRTYNVWSKMLSRCNDPNLEAYEKYGGRGIKVCERWHKFENFLADMGEIPKGLTIERKNNNLGYFKDNCCYADMKTQSNNRRSNHIVEYQGKKFTLIQLAEFTGVDYGMLRQRISTRKWSPEKAVNTPNQSHRVGRQT